jgi:hypothetical protein
MTLRNKIHSYIRNEIIKPQIEKGVMNENYQKGKEGIVNAHVEKVLFEFNNRIKKLTVENNYPYIRLYLTKAVWDIQEAISDGRIQILGIDELLI